jgi:hypothetical protein
MKTLKFAVMAADLLNLVTIGVETSKILILPLIFPHFERDARNSGL